MGFFISRLLLTIFDFSLTHFDASKFYLVPNVIFWKIAFFILYTTLAIFIYNLDKKALEFKFKGVFGFIVLGLNIGLLFFPVANKADFTAMEYYALSITFIAIIIPIFFLYIAIKAPSKSDLRKFSLAMAFGFIIYAIGANLLGEGILAPIRESYGELAVLAIWIVSLILKTIGLLTFAYGATKIKT